MGLFKKTSKDHLKKGKRLRQQGLYEEALIVFDAVEGSDRAFAEFDMYECCMTLYERTADPAMRDAARDHLICAAKGGIMTAPALLAKEFKIFDYLPPGEREKEERFARLLDEMFPGTSEATSHPE